MAWTEYQQICQKCQKLREEKVTPWLIPSEMEPSDSVLYYSIAIFEISIFCISINLLITPFVISTSHPHLSGGIEPSLPKVTRSLQNTKTKRFALSITSKTSRVLLEVILTSFLLQDLRNSWEARLLNQVDQYRAGQCPCEPGHSEPGHISNMLGIV